MRWSRENWSHRRVLSRSHLLSCRRRWSKFPTSTRARRLTIPVARSFPLAGKNFVLVARMEDLCLRCCFRELARNLQRHSVLLSEQHNFISHANLRVSALDSCLDWGLDRPSSSTSSSRRDRSLDRRSFPLGPTLLSRSSPMTTGTFRSHVQKFWSEKCVQIFCILRIEVSIDIPERERIAFRIAEANVEALV